MAEEEPTSTKSDEVDAAARQDPASPHPADSTEGRRSGTCKWYNVTKGWGFISPDDGGTEVFVHQSVIQMAGFRSLAKGEALQFEAKASDKGMEATLVMGASGDKELQGSTYRPKKRTRKMRRCYNCGQFANHIASKCELGNQPKRCHQCKSEDHLVVDCPEKPPVQGKKAEESPPSESPS